MTTARVLISPAPASQPRSFSEPQPQRHLHLVPSPQLTIDDLIRDRSPGATERRPAAPPRPSGLADADALIRGFFVAVAEVMVGRRSVDQLSRNATLPVLQWLRSVRPRGRAAAAVAPPRVRTVHVCRVHDGAYEATAVIQHGPHVRAMNARFLGLDRRWQCMHLELV